MTDGWYDTAQICINGHVVNWMSKSHPEHNKKYCDKCGALTINNCPNCNAPIRGYYHEAHGAYEEIDTMVNEILTPPPETILDYSKPRGFCHVCGEPYPWTEAKLKAAQELSDEVDNLTPEERELLKKSLDDIVRDTPQSTVAATRFKRLVAKAGQVAADGFRDILVDVLSEAAKKIIWP